MKDLEKMSDRELLEEFADRAIAYQASTEKVDEYERAHPQGLDTEEYRDLVMEHDEDFCLLREIVRLVKKDDGIWVC